MRLLEVLLMTLGGVWQGVRQDWNLLEIVIILAGAWAWKRGWRPAWKPLRVPRKPWVLALGLVLGTIGLRLSLLPFLPAPIPVVNDEFSHLLLADTLLHGRVANPTHAFWQHFESIHILQKPHYVSNYFPGHAVLLAAGRLVAGNPWTGVLAECGIFLAALYWALRGWMPARWALFGLLLAALRFGIGSYWVNSFWGGFLGAAGGALVFGAAPRLLRKPSWIQGLVLGAGLAILLSTRPFEGAFISLPLILAVGWRLRRNVVGFAQVALAAGLAAGLAAAALGFYNYRITGSPLVTPYQVSQKTYGWPMTLVWMKPPVIQQPHIELATYYNFELSEHDRASGPVNSIEYLTFRLQESWRFFLGPMLSIPLVMFGRVWTRRKLLIATVMGGVVAALLETTAVPHYLSPATAAIVALVVECARHLHATRVGGVWWLPTAMVLVLTVRVAAQNLGLPYTQKLNYASWCCKVEGNLNKARIGTLLAQLPGRHLVLVKAKTDENNLLQWIYNDADIDASRIVWARDLGPARNAALTNYFAGREVWLVDPNVEPATCVRYQPMNLAMGETAPHAKPQSTHQEGSKPLPSVVAR